MPRSTNRRTVVRTADASPRSTRRSTDAVVETSAREAVVSKTVKLPLSLDDRLRRHCLTVRRTGQDVMHDAILAFLEQAERAGAA